MIKTSRILLMFSLLGSIFGQNAEEFKRFMETYDKLQVDQQANEVFKKNIESEADYENGPIRLLINPGDMTKYYREKMNLIQKDLVRHGWSNVIVYVEEVKSGYREVNLRRNMVSDRGKTVKVSIYNKTD